MSENRFKGKHVAVLTAHEGVGPAIVSAFVDAGAEVVVDHMFDDLPVTKVGELEPEEAIEACETAIGPLDILVLSARPVKSQPILDVSPKDLRDIVEEDLIRPALAMQEAARRMASRGYGRIVVLASMSAKTGAHANVAPYAAAKGGLLALVRVLATEMASQGVTVNAVATALFEPQVARMDVAKRDRLITEIPVQRFGKPIEAAEAVLYLASKNSGFVTGEVLNLSGGRFMD